MSWYPKIYSVSTVGVRQHNNVDFLLHSIRTDFTGDNGLGKSVIGDLLQLIFVPKRAKSKRDVDGWVSGTGGVGGQDRKIELIPLQKDYIRFAYTFINIEKRPGQFITIGSYIPRSSREPVRPFIVQGSENFDNKLLCFSAPLSYKDFLGTKNKILDLTELKKRFILKNLFLEDYYQSEAVDRYFSILYRNEILPMDLSKGNNLKAFAKILQSFSKADTLDINNSASMKNFLFDDNDEIKEYYRDHEIKLQDCIKEHRECADAMHDLQKKQKRLTELKSVLDSKNDAQKHFLQLDVLLNFNEFLKAKTNLKTTEEKLETAREKMMQYQAHMDEVNEQLNVVVKELDTLEKDLRFLNRYHQEYTELQASIHNINNKKKQVEEKKDAIKKEEERLENLKQEFKEHQSKLPLTNEAVKIARGKADSLAAKVNHALKYKYLFEQFGDPEQLKLKHQVEEKKYLELINFIDRKIEDLTSLIGLYSNEQQGSLFKWAINQKRSLSVEEESVLMHFRSILINKPSSPTLGTRFSLTPENIFRKIKKDDHNQGLWLEMGAITEFVPLVSNRLFSDADKLKTVLENEEKAIREQIASMQEKKQKVSGKDQDALEQEKINIALLFLNTNDRLDDAFETFKTFDRIIENKERAIRDVENFTKEIGALEENIKRFTGAITVAVNEIEDGHKQQKKLLEEIKRLEQNQAKLESSLIEAKSQVSVSFDDQKLKGYIDEKERLRIDLRGDYDELKERQTRINGQLHAAKTEKYNCETLLPGYRDSFEQNEKAYQVKLKNLEKEFDEPFDPSSYPGSINSEEVKKAESLAKALDEQYKQAFVRVEQEFEESRDGRNEELKSNQYHFETLERVLCGKLKHTQNISDEIISLQVQVEKIARTQLDYIYNVFSKVEKTYRAYRNTINDLNFFFEGHKISRDYRFRVDFITRTDITIDWIAKMKEAARVNNYGRDLFTQHAVSPGELIVELAQKFSKVKNCELGDLLNPMYYFNLAVGLYDEAGVKNAGSNGQAYMAIAMLCIGRLSIVQQGRRGVRFIIIEELSDIDENNFSIFPEIAERFNYQLITMTPKPYGSYTDTEWYLHILVRGKEKDINYPPMSFFRTKNAKKILEQYLKPENTIKGEV